MTGFRLFATALIGAVSVAALASTTASASSKADDAGKMNGTAKNFVGKNYLERAEQRKSAARLRRAKREARWFYPDDDFGGFEDYDPFPRFMAPRRAKRAFFNSTSSTYKAKSPDDGFGTYVPPKLVKLQDPLLDAVKPDRVLASSVLYELRNGEAANRVSENHRAAIVSFYRNRSFEPMWITSEGLNDKARRVLAHLALADREGLSAADYLPPTLGSFADDGSVFRGDITHLARLELSVTVLALRYAQHAYGGRIVPKKMSGYYDIVPPQLDATAFLSELSWRLVPDVYLAGLQPVHPSYAAMKSALADLRSKAERQEEPIATGARVKVGERDGRVPAIRARLAKLGHLQPAAMPKFGADGGKGTYSPSEEEAGEFFAEIAASEILDKDLSKALIAFQKSQSIKATGRIDAATVTALNQRPDGNKLQKLILNMERVRWMPRQLGARHILVNQAAFELRLMDHDRIRWQTKVIVGKPETQTFVFSDVMETVVVNPYWGVPLSIIQGEMMPRLAEDPSYLDREGYEVLTRDGDQVSSSSVDWWAYGSKLPYDVRQPPGPGNALGYVKFLFPNAHDIYMHDTPTRKLFAESKRAFSHGCIRVENPRELAVQVLGWSRDEVDAAIETGANQNFDLDRKIPVHINYFTAWPDPNGKIGYFADTYGRDDRLEKALNTLTVAAN